MVNSMTGFAAGTGQTDHYSWVFEIKSVNARGLDVRMRFAEGGEQLEPYVKKLITQSVSRGTINVSVRTEYRGQASVPQLDRAALDAALTALHQIEERALQDGQNLAPTTGGALLGLRGVFEPSATQADASEVIEAVKQAAPDVIQEFVKSRADEGAALQTVLAEQIATIGALTQDAKNAAGARADYVAKRLRENLALVMSNVDGLEEARVEQELALLAVKADITEEIDRLTAHVNAAQDLLKTKGAIGRKFDFLMQEFNREANTLCSKSGSSELTRIGLELKTVIDQMREQVQNVE